MIFTEDNLLMDSNMEKEMKNIQMVMFIEENSLMDCQKALDSIDGLMELYTEGISSKDTEMVMVIGNQQRSKKVLKDTICWIESMVMGNIVGVQVKFIKVFTLRMQEVATVSC